MAEINATFEFDENSSLDDNLTAFGNYICQLDAELGEAMRNRLQSLLNDDYETNEIWDQMMTVCMTPSATEGDTECIENETPANEAAASPSQPPATLLPIVTGWLLKGISIEGFRGVNNESQPLELKFNPNTVSSISAVNGVGKTSIFDSIRYAITGTLPWLDGLPPADRDKDYYLNRFNSSGQATIKLQLVAEPGGEKCEITVIRDSSGTHTVSASAPWKAESLLNALNREFVFLDGPTFQKFIDAPPLDRGRMFSGLLGLSAYTEIRHALASLARTLAFNNHFEVTAHGQIKKQEERTTSELAGAIAKDFEVLVGTPLGSDDATTAKEKCKAALAQIALLSPLCKEVDFDEINFDGCIEAIKVAEGGPKRERLGVCIQERSELSKINHAAPTEERAEQLAIRAAERDNALEKTSGDLMLQLYQTGLGILKLPDWTDPNLCPLCDANRDHNLEDHLASKLSQFETLDAATAALTTEWSEAGWTDLLQLETALEPDLNKRLFAACQTRAQSGVISSKDARAIVKWLKTLRERASDRDEKLAEEQTQLEQELPPSSVEVTTKVEVARRMQENWRKLERSKKKLSEEAARDVHINRLKAFLTDSSKAFSSAEAGMSRARLAAVEPVFKDFFKKMSFHGVEPAVSKRGDSENLQIRLAHFFGLADVSPQALLSESFRNAFAISLYLAAASLYSGLPKFVILDDVTSSFDAGHQHFLIELIRTTFARPGNQTGPQVILFSHDTMLEKLFNKHGNSSTWSHQRIEGTPQVAVLPQAGAVNKVRDRTISMLQSGQVDFAKEGVRQYLEYRLSNLISELRIPVPSDIAFNDDKQLPGEFIKAIDAAVKLHKAANSLVLDQTQQSGLNANMVTIVGNFLSHWGTGQTLAFNALVLLGVMQAIDDYCDCFTFTPTPGATKKYYTSLSQK